MDKGQDAGNGRDDQDDEVRVYYSDSEGDGRCSEVEDKYDSFDEEPYLSDDSLFQGDYESDSHSAVDGDLRFPEDIANRDSTARQVSVPAAEAGFDGAGHELRASNPTHDGDDLQACEGDCMHEDSDEDESDRGDSHINDGDSEREVYTPYDDSVYGEDHPIADEEQVGYGDSERELHTLYDASACGEDDLSCSDYECKVYTPYDESVLSGDSIYLDEDNFSYGDSERDLYTPYGESASSDDRPDIDEDDLSRGASECDVYTPCDEAVHIESSINLDEHNLSYGDSERDLYTPYDDSACGEDHLNIGEESDNYEREVYTPYDSLNIAEDGVNYGGSEHGESERDVYTPYEEPACGEDCLNIGEDSDNYEDEVYTPYDSLNIVEDRVNYGDSEHEMYIPHDESPGSEDHQNVSGNEDNNYRCEIESASLVNFSYREFLGDQAGSNAANRDEEADFTNERNHEGLAIHDECFPCSAEGVEELASCNDGEENYHECEIVRDELKDGTYTATPVATYIDDEEIPGIRNDRTRFRAVGGEMDNVEYLDDHNNLGMKPSDGSEEQLNRDSRVKRCVRNGVCAGGVTVSEHFDDVDRSNVHEDQHFYDGEARPVECAFTCSDIQGDLNETELEGICNNGLSIPETLDHFDTIDDESDPVVDYDILEDEVGSLGCEVVYDDPDNEPSFSGDFNDYHDVEDEAVTPEGEISFNFVDDEINLPEIEDNHICRRDEEIINDESSNDDDEIVKLTESMSLEASSSTKQEEKGKEMGDGEPERKGITFRETVLEEALLSLERENKKYRESQICKVCLNQDLEVVFLPCGHLATCSVCSRHLYSCPLCRRAIINKIRVYKS